MSKKSKSTTFLLCYFLGLLGVHRFYVGKILTGILMLLTLGGLGIWWLVDSVLIAAGQMKDKDGDPLRTGPPDPDDPSAGFWVRAAAFSVDGLILNVILSVLFMALALVLPLLGLGAMGALGDGLLGEGLGAGLAGDVSALSADEQAMLAQMGLMLSAGALLTGVAASLVYFGFQHGSEHQATIGKRCFDIYVARSNGHRVGYGRALWRTLCYFFSAIPLYLGFFMAGGTAKKRALHDYMAGTRVLYLDDPDAHPSATAPIRAHDAGRAPAATPPAAGASNQGIGLIILGGALMAGAVALALTMG